MQRKSFDDMPCPIARGLERVGEWWSMLILRDALAGLTRFDEFEKSLGIAPNLLTRRLTALVEEGLLERRQYCDKPPRYEYRPTACGRDFRPVLLTLLEWGNRHFTAAGDGVMLRDADTGAEVRPLLIDANTGKPIDNIRLTLSAGPEASEALKARLAFIAERRRSRAGEGAGLGVG